MKVLQSYELPTFYTKFKRSACPCVIIVQRQTISPFVSTVESNKECRKGKGGGGGVCVVVWCGLLHRAARTRSRGLVVWCGVVWCLSVCLCVCVSMVGQGEDGPRRLDLKPDASGFGVRHL